MILLAAIVVPLGLDAYLPAPENNPLEAEKVALGRKLFFDKRLSRDSAISCATCHKPEMAFSDANPVAIGIRGQKGTRRTPRILNRAYGRRFFWDGRAATLEDQVLQPVQNPLEMDLPLSEIPKRFDRPVEQVRDALASYVRTILAGDSPYDRDQLTGEQRLGLRLFRGKAGCSSCHVGPNLTDEKLHNTGKGSFKTPSLREVSRTPPFMHDGSIATLEDAIEFYDKGGKPVPDLDPEIRPLHLTADEKAAIAAFLRALSGTVRDGM